MDVLNWKWNDSSQDNTQAGHNTVLYGV